MEMNMSLHMKSELQQMHLTDDYYRLRLNQTAMKRKMLGITVTDRKTNAWLSRSTEIQVRVIILAWNWAGHLATVQA